MRERMEAEIRGVAHDRYSEWLREQSGGAAPSPFRHIRHIRVPAQLFAAVAAVSLAGITLGMAIA